MEHIIALIVLYSHMYGVDPNLVKSIVQVESQYNANAVGELGEIGLMQLRPEYFPEVKPKDLFKPEVNLKLGIRHLADSRKYCKHKEDFEFVVCFNSGVTRGSSFKYPKLRKYYKNVMAEYRQLH